MQQTSKKEVILVTLGNSERPVKVWRKDLAKVQAKGFAGAWFLNGDRDGRQYVRTSHSKLNGSLETVARIIADALPGQIVRYKDGDRLNLCRDNLRLCEGFSKLRRIEEEEVY